jgi:ABC-type phosphate transport system auxiliary subunit
MLGMGAGDAVFVSKTLLGMGVEGAIITVLMFVVSLLAGVIVIQWKQANKIYGFRLSERDTLNKALTDSTTSLRDMFKAAEERNEIVDNLSDVIEKQAAAFDAVAERVRLQYEVMRDDQKAVSQIVSALSESVRTVSSKVEEVKSGMPAIVAAVRDAVMQTPRPGRRT